MMLTEERHTPKAVSFRVQLPGANLSTKNPEVKKRLELSAQKAAQGPQITIEDISNKLQRAEEKRKLSQTQHISPQAELRRLNAWENKKYYEKQQQEHLRQKFEEVLPTAAEKRRATCESKRQKLRDHIARVEENRKKQAIKRKESLDNLKTELDNKLQHADQQHQNILEQKINTAQYSAEKKKHAGITTGLYTGGQFTQGDQAGIPYDEIPLPVRRTDLNEQFSQYEQLNQEQIFNIKK
eukprot:403344922